VTDRQTDTGVVSDVTASMFTLPATQYDLHTSTNTQATEQNNTNIYHIQVAVRTRKVE